MHSHALSLHRHAHCSSIIAAIVRQVYSSTPIAGHSLSRLRYKRDSGHKPSNRYCPDNIGTVGQSVNRGKENSRGSMYDIFR